MLLNFSQEFYDVIEEIKALATELEKLWREFIEDFQKKKENEEIEEIEAHLKPCLCVPLPPRTYRGFKLWRKNQALFRPYKKTRRRNNFKMQMEGNL